MYWNVPAGDISCQFLGGHQPPCAEAVNQHLLDGSLVGDPSPVATKGASHITPIPGYDEAKAKQFAVDHPDFFAARKQAALDLIERAKISRARNPRTRAAAPAPD